MMSRAMMGATLALLAMGVSTPSVGAATIVPNTAADDYDAVADGDCSLREAIQSVGQAADFGSCVNTGGGYGSDTILLSSGTTYVRTIPDTAGDDDGNVTGDLDIAAQELTIGMLGTATSGAVIEGNNTPTGGRVLDIQNGNVTVSGVTIRGGNSDAAVGEDGGGVKNVTTVGTLRLTGVTISGNVAEDGGGIFTLDPAILSNVTISGNLATNYGGGLYTGDGPINLNNVTIAANTADSDASGVGDGGGLLVDGAADTLNLSNTIVAGNSDASAGAEMPDCEPGATSLGYNLIGNSSGCSWASATGDVLDPVAGPGLAVLKSNGGFTQTHALLPGSPAIEAGNPAPPDNIAPACATADQRGTVRPVGTRCDIGAFEYTPTGVKGPAPTGDGKKKCKKKKKKKKAAAAKKCKKKKKKR